MSFVKRERDKHSFSCGIKTGKTFLFFSLLEELLGLVLLLFYLHIMILNSNFSVPNLPVKLVGWHPEWQSVWISNCPLMQESHRQTHSLHHTVHADPPTLPYSHTHSHTTHADPPTLPHTVPTNAHTRILFLNVMNCAWLVQSVPINDPQHMLQLIMSPLNHKVCLHSL